MRQILWFRRDLRICDNAILANASGEVLPIFIFDSNILEKLPSDDLRVTFVFDSVIKLKEKLESIGLDLYIFFGKPVEIFEQFKSLQIDEVLVSCDFDHYAKSRDEVIAKEYKLRRFYDSWLIHPEETLKSDKTPYKVFTPFYKSLSAFFDNKIETFKPSQNLKLINFESSHISLESLGFARQKLPTFLNQEPFEILNEFRSKIDNYDITRDLFYMDGTSNLSVFLRFGLISPKQILNQILTWREEGHNIETFKKELFWREFYNSILYHFPKSEFENFNNFEVQWQNDENLFEAWCEGKTGVPIIDAAMKHLNATGMMPNRLRMVVSSFLTKNLLIDWRWGERYFAQKLLDYECSSNVGSWQWSASTGADAVPYFRVFNPYAQSLKFDPQCKFIKSNLPELKNIPTKILHNEKAIEGYVTPIVDVKFSAKKAIDVFAKSKG